MKKLLIVDIDGTICESGQNITQEMHDILESMTHIYDLCFCGGGTFEKIHQQLGQSIDLFTHCYYESGNVSKVNGAKYIIHDIRSYINQLEPLFAHCLTFISQLSIHNNLDPIDIRHGIIYISLCGIGANQQQRRVFIDLDQKHHVRKQLIQELLDLDSSKQFHISLGGQTGITITLVGWDKSQIMTHDKIAKYKNVYFIGDQTDLNGNDYSLYTYPGIQSFSTCSLSNTIDIMKKIVT